MRVAAAAQRSLDLQYYIWQNDTTGSLLFKALLDAAGRGVKVRLLLDDNNTAQLDPTLAALDAHANIEVRLFNPFMVRRPHWLGYLTDFARLNRRMHNKSFTADRRVTIVGGRNIGDEYFGAAAAAVVFADLDVMAEGPVANDVAEEFDRYWFSRWAWAVNRLLPRASADELAQLTSRLTPLERSEPATSVSFRMNAEKVPVTVISDDPSKASGRAARKSLVIEKIKTIFGEPDQTIDLISPYFVPGPRGTEVLRRWSKSGVRIRILTNALEATDVAIVHAGYAKYRRALLQAGIKLYELRREARIPLRRTGVKGSSGSSLHAKTFAVDGCRAFVGSFNFDPRSARLNTEMGLVIEDHQIAGNIATAFDTTIPMNSYEVHLSESGQLYWTGASERFDSEPGATLGRRLTMAIASRLPIEWLL